MEIPTKLESLEFRFRYSKAFCVLYLLKSLVANMRYPEKVLALFPENLYKIFTEGKGKNFSGLVVEFCEGLECESIYKTFCDYFCSERQNSEFLLENSEIRVSAKVISEYFSLSDFVKNQSMEFGFWVFFKIENERSLELIESYHERLCGLAKILNDLLTFFSNSFRKSQKYELVAIVCNKDTNYKVIYSEKQSIFVSSGLWVECYEEWIEAIFSCIEADYFPIYFCYLANRQKGRRPYQIKENHLSVFEAYFSELCPKGYFSTFSKARHEGILKKSDFFRSNENKITSENVPEPISTIETKEKNYQEEYKMAAIEDFEPCQDPISFHYPQKLSDSSHISQNYNENISQKLESPYKCSENNPKLISYQENPDNSISELTFSFKKPKLFISNKSCHEGGQSTDKNFELETANHVYITEAFINKEVLESIKTQQKLYQILYKQDFLIQDKPIVDLEFFQNFPNDKIQESPNNTFTDEFVFLSNSPESLSRKAPNPIKEADFPLSFSHISCTSLEESRFLQENSIKVPTESIFYPIPNIKVPKPLSPTSPRPSFLIESPPQSPQLLQSSEIPEPSSNLAKKLIKKFSKNVIDKLFN